ncbi:MAG TPA: SPOR domain-containing protein [Allosphingosinicella sp.]|jgi:tetratricopeptide (TPR) repeat protein
MAAMTLSKWGARFGLAVLGAGILLAGGPLIAQPNGAWAGESPADALSRNLRSLAADPRNLPALMSAGQAALSLGDAQAALTFFARAEEVAPRDGRIKMWMASALVQLEQPRAALKFFKDATDLGVTDAEMARDRGLAYDISGDPRRAQRDYRLALQHGGDAEVTRRLALSLAITGDREAALQQLEPQLRTGDRAAERTRALVLALTGDAAGAGQAVQSAMPGPQGEAMMPFLARLPSLSYADRALAVHLGHFPRDGRTMPAAVYASNAAAQPASRAAPARSATDAGRPDPAQELLQRRISNGETARPASPVPAPNRIASAAPAKPAARVAGTAPPVSSWSWSRREAEAATARPLRRPETTAPTVRARPQAALPSDRPVPAAVSPSTFTLPPGSRPSAVVAEADPAAVAPSSAPPPAGSVEPAAEARPEPVAAEPRPTPALPAMNHASSRLADLAAAVAGIAEPPPAPASPAPRRESTAARAPARHVGAEETAPVKPGSRRGAGETAEAKPDKKGRAAVAASAPPKKPPPPREPSRVWVQIAGGADRDALPREFSRLKAKAPKLLASRTPWTAKLNATNRLLVGPFADAEAAQDFVNALRKVELSGFAWTSEAGEKVEKLAAK